MPTRSRAVNGVPVSKTLRFPARAALGRTIHLFSSAAEMPPTPEAGDQP
jgi:hypothetical protein